MTPARPAYDPVSLAPLSFWTRSSAEKELDFRILRNERPVSWHPAAGWGSSAVGSEPQRFSRLRS